MTTAAQELRQKIQTKKSELDRLYDDIEALQRALSILEADSGRGRRSRRQQSFQRLVGLVRHKRNGPKISDAVYKVLKEAGKPLSSNQLIPLVYAQGIHSTGQSILGAVYRSIKQRKLLKLHKPGMFGLLEWETKKQLDKAIG